MQSLIGLYNSLDEKRVVIRKIIEQRKSDLQGWGPQEHMSSEEMEIQLVDQFGKPLFQDLLIAEANLLAGMATLRAAHETTRHK